jgi:hypothetical protein
MERERCTAQDQSYSRLHNSVNTENSFFGHDVTDHLIKPSLRLLN